MKFFHNRKFTKISEKVVTCHKFLVMIMVMKFSKAPDSVVISGQTIVDVVALYVVALNA
jgi:hypothetical protein